MRWKRKIAAFLIFIVTICILALITSKISTNNETLGDTGWTVEQFVEWAEKVQPIKEHKRWKIWKEEGIEIKKLMDPNEPFHPGIINDVNDVPTASVYKYEWEFELPKDVPPPVIKVLMSVHHDDVGKNVRDIFPYVTEQLVAVCALKDGEVVSSEPLEVKLLGMSSSKFEFTIETEPFAISEVEEVRGRIDGKLVLYVPIDPNCKVGICESEKRDDWL